MHSPKPCAHAADAPVRANSSPPASRCCYDDRDARPGVKFADAELLGIPHRVVIGERGLAAGQLEYRHRRAGDNRGVSRSMPRSASSARACRPRRGACARWPRRGRCCWRWRRPAPRARPPMRSATRSCAPSCSGHPAGASASPDKYDSAVWYTLMEPQAAPLREGSRRAHADPQDRVLRGASPRRARACRRAWCWRCMDVESRFDRWAVSQRRRRGPDAGDAVLARGARHAAPPAHADRGQHPHGLRHPALLPASASTTTCAARWRATTAASARASTPTWSSNRWTRYWNGADDLGLAVKRQR